MRSWWTGKCAPPFSACKQLRTPNSRASEPGDCQNPSRSAFCQSLSVCLSGLASMCVLVAARLWKMSISKASKAVDCLHFPVVGLSVGACLSVCLVCAVCAYHKVKAPSSKTGFRQSPGAAGVLLGALTFYMCTKHTLYRQTLPGSGALLLGVSELMVCVCYVHRHNTEAGRH